MLLVSVTCLRMHEAPIGRFTSSLKLEHETMSASANAVKSSAGPFISEDET